MIEVYSILKNKKKKKLIDNYNINNMICFKKIKFKIKK